MKSYKVAVVGATGMVGRKFLQVLSERNLPVSEYFLFASERSAGQKIDFMGKEHTVIELNEENVKNYPVDIALFSAGASTSKKFAPIFAENGTIVIDNSSCWRMDPDIPLVVPEVNPEDIDKNHGIIANPNCSTIQAVVALKPLYDAFGIKRIVYTTFQAVSGAGMKGYSDLVNNAKEGELQKFPYPITGNCLPHIDDFLDNGYTKEEMKMVNETRKILHDDSIKITATTVRVPVTYGHSESINVEFKKPCTIDEVKYALSHFCDNLILQDDPQSNVYPMAIYAEDKDEVFVGRVRIDDSLDSGANIWVVADNIRKGAATNAVQIAEIIMKKDN